MDKKKLFLIDGTYYLYNSYYAFSSLKNNNGKPTGVIFGMINMIYSLIDTFNPKYIAIIFDHKKKNFRKKIFKKYKSNRSSIPIDLKKQIKPIKKILKYMGIMSLSIPKMEADDVIGTIAKKYSKKKEFTILIKSHDQDMIQLVKKNIKIINNKNIILDYNLIKKIYNISPEFRKDYIALSGDKSDNIPGIPGIGKITANKLIQAFGNIKNIYKNINNIHKLPIRRKEDIINKLIIYKKEVFLYKLIATIKTDIKLNINDNNFLIKVKNIKKLKQIFKFYQLNKFLLRINKQK